MSVRYRRQQIAGAKLRGIKASQNKKKDYNTGCDTEAVISAF